MKLRNHICRVNHEGQVPDGYIRNTVSMERVPARLQKSWSNWVNKRIKSTDRDGWTHDAYCVGGHAEHYGGGTFYLHRDDLERLVKEYMSFQEQSFSAMTSDATPLVVQNMSASQVEAGVTALCEINNKLAVIGDTLRDLVAAMQLLGEQQSKQREPVGTWRDMNGQAL